MVMKERIAAMKNTSIRVVKVVPRRQRRALELYQDNRFKPRVIPNRKLYSRKNRQVEIG